MLLTDLTFKKLLDYYPRKFQKTHQSELKIKNVFKRKAVPVGLSKLSDVVKND